VSDTTLRFDRKVKAPVYAKEGVREVWIVDLKGKAVENHRQPSAEGYGITERRRRGETLTPEGLPDLVVSVDEILG